MIGLPILAKVLPFLAKNWVAVILIGMLAGTQVQLAGSRRETRALLSVVNDQKQQLADARGTIKQLDEAVRNQKPGETKIVFVPKPEYIHLPGKEIPVVITRTEKTIETKVADPIVLPPKEIEKIINTAPQSLIFNLEATRDIQKGEKFRVVAAQIAPGAYQPILELGSPVTGTVTTVTPVDKIPQVREPSRLSFMAYTGFSSVDQMIAGLRVHYALTPTWGLEGQAERRFGPALWEYRLLATARW